MKTLQCYRKAVHYSEEWKSEILLFNLIDLPPKRLFLFISSWKAVDIVTVPIVWADWSTNWCQFLYLHRKWKFWWHVEINSNRTIDVDPILQGDFLKCNTLPRPPPPHSYCKDMLRFWFQIMHCCPWKFPRPWKFPWVSTLGTAWNFPWPMEISMGVLITNSKTLEISMG